jgi:uncharacterized protein (TIGR02996 family)
MSDEAAFLNAVLFDPQDEAPRLVYADWLDEQEDPAAAAKATFVRTDARLKLLPDRHRGREPLVSQLKALARHLDPGWLSVVSRLPIENCTLIANRCPKRWEGLEPTDAVNVRFCSECERTVHYCPTIQAARKHALAGDCIAVDVAIPRKDGDLEKPLMVLGRPGPAARARMRAAWEVDEVSQERTRRGVVSA